jgi:hypothetical protein
VTPTPWTNINGNTINVGNFTPQIVPTTQLMSGSVSVTGIGPSTVAVWLNAGASIIIAPSYTYTPTLTPISSYTPTVTPTVTATPTATFTPTFQSVVVVSGDIYSPVTVNLNHNTNGLELMMTESVNLVASGQATIYVDPMPVGQIPSSLWNYAITYYGTGSTTYQDFTVASSSIRSFNKFIIRPQVTATQTVVVTYVINLNIPGPFSFNPAIESQRKAWNNYVPWWKVIWG